MCNCDRQKSFDCRVLPQQGHTGRLGWVPQWVPDPFGLRLLEERSGQKASNKLSV